MIISQTTPEPALVVYPNPARLIRTMVFVGLFSLILLSLAILSFPAFGPIIGSVNVLIALSPLLLYLSSYWNWKDAKERRRPSVYVNHAGITVITAPARASFVPWSAVKGFVVVRNFYGTENRLQIRVRDRKAVTTPAPATKPALIGGGKHLAISRAYSPVRLGQLYQQIIAYDPRSSAESVPR